MGYDEVKPEYIYAIMTKNASNLASLKHKQKVETFCVNNTRINTFLFIVYIQCYTHRKLSRLYIIGVYVIFIYIHI